MQENHEARQEPITRGPGNELDGPAAYVLANRLIIIPRFPRDPVAVEQIADWLLDLCRGTEVDGDPWTPHDQATWLIDAAVKEFPNWDQAQGLPAMRAIFNRKFNPPPEQIDYRSLGDPPAPDCKLCNDDGTVERDDRVHWCVCEQAGLLIRDAPQLVEILDRALQRRLAAARRHREKEAELEQRRAAFRPKSPAEQQRMADIRVEIARVAREREQHAKTQKLWTGALSFLRRSRLYGVLWNWGRRILRARAS